MSQNDALPQTDLTTIFMHWLLLQLGGQVTMNVGEIEPLTRTYAGTRIAYNTQTGDITLTLRTVEGENDRPPVPEPASGDSSESKRAH